MEERDGGVLLPVRAQPGARKDGIAGWLDGRLKVSVTQVPEKGKANKALIKLLAKWLDIPKSRIELVTGEKSPQKVFLIKHISADELTTKIANLLPEES